MSAIPPVKKSGYIVTFLVLKIFIKNHTFRRELYIFLTVLIITNSPVLISFFHEVEVDSGSNYVIIKEKEYVVEQYPNGNNKTTLVYENDDSTAMLYAMLHYDYNGVLYMQERINGKVNMKLTENNSLKISINDITYYEFQLAEINYFGWYPIPKHATHIFISAEHWLNQNDCIVRVRYQTPINDDLKLNQEITRYAEIDTSYSGWWNFTNIENAMPSYEFEDPFENITMFM